MYNVNKEFAELGKKEIAKLEKIIAENEKSEKLKERPSDISNFQSHPPFQPLSNPILPFSFNNNSFANTPVVSSLVTQDRDHVNSESLYERDRKPQKKDDQKKDDLNFER